jgi:hypothetical protein
MMRVMTKRKIKNESTWTSMVALMLTSSVWLTISIGALPG